MIKPSRESMERLCFERAMFYYAYGECAYLREIPRTLFQYGSIRFCDGEFYDALLARGWRRFGEEFFAPFCESCEACVSIRVLVADFALSKNHKRVLSKNKNLTLKISKPSVSAAKIELFNRYHSEMSLKKGWDYNQTSEERYYRMFVAGGGDFAHEICYFSGRRLVGVAFVDVLKNAMSANYFFYDHAFSSQSLGTFSILKQLEIARERGVAYLYPGYWIKDHRSLGYKERFKPFEVLLNRANLYEMPIWIRP